MIFFSVIPILCIKEKVTIFYYTISATSENLKEPEPELKFSTACNYAMFPIDFAAFN